MNSWKCTWEIRLPARLTFRKHLNRPTPSFYPLLYNVGLDKEKSRWSINSQLLGPMSHEPSLLYCFACAMNHSTLFYVDFWCLQLLPELFAYETGLWRFQKRFFHNYCEIRMNVDKTPSSSLGYRKTNGDKTQPNQALQRCIERCIARCRLLPTVRLSCQNISPAHSASGVAKGDRPPIFQTKQAYV